MKLETITTVELTAEEVREAIAQYASSANAGEFVFDPETVKVRNNKDALITRQITASVSTC